MDSPLVIGGLAAALFAVVMWCRLPKPYRFSLPADIAARAEKISLPKYKIEGPVLVTGGAGFLGKHIVEALLAQGTGIKVVVFDLASNYQPPAGVVFIRGNLVKREEITAALKQHNIKAVFHVASPDPNSQNRQLFKDVNVTGTQNVIDCCKECGVKTLIYTSSASVVWQGQGQEGVDESTPYPTTFRDPYAETKAEAEQLIIKAGLQGKKDGSLIAIGLRPHAIFGPRDPTMLPTLVGLAKNGKQRFIVGSGSNTVDWTYVGNVVHSHLLACEVAQKHLAANAADGQGPAKCSANGKSFFITNNQPMPFWQFMNSILLGLGYEPASARIPYRFVLFIAHIAVAIVGFLNKSRPKEKQIPLTLSPSRLQIAGTAHWYCIDAAKKDLGYMPVWNMDEALYLTLKAFNHVRCGKPGPKALKNAREGNLVKLKLVDDTEARAQQRDSATIHKDDKTMRGANEAFADEASLPFYTKEEVAKHNTKEDLWVIVDGKVYDLTRYVDPHPGGEGILNHAGGDSSEGFHGPQHPDHVHVTLRKFIIGKLKK